MFRHDEEKEQEPVKAHGHVSHLLTSISMLRQRSRQYELWQTEMKISCKPFFSTKVFFSDNCCFRLRFYLSLYQSKITGFCKGRFILKFNLGVNWPNFSLYELLSHH